MVSSILWDDEACTVISERWARFCRDAGALSDLLLALSFSTHVLLFAGDLSGAASLVEEVRAATDARGINFEPIGAMALAAFRGNEAEASPFIEANVSQARHRREGNRLAVATWASAVLNNGLGRYQDALAAAQQATDPLDVIHPYWALAELIEAAVRSGTTAAAADAYRRLAEMATATASDWALARVSDDHEAGWSFPLVICGAGSRFRVLPMSAPGGVAGEAEDAGELVLDRGGLGEHAVGSGPAAAAVVEQDGLADAGEFGE